MACVAAISPVACADELRSPAVLTDEAVVMGISLAVLEDGPHATDFVALPADRPRAEVLPLDAVELDALVANVDGPLALDDAAWVLCGDGCLASLAKQGERRGALEPCVEDSAARSFACLAGRGARPRVEMPAVHAPPEGGPVRGAYAFVRVAVIVGGPEGPSTDECLRQLVQGPRTDLWGCAIGVRELPYGPVWVLPEIQRELGIDDAEATVPPRLVGELLPPNAAPRIEEVRLGSPRELVGGRSEMDDEPRRVDEVVELAAGARARIEPVVASRDQQLELWESEPDVWSGRYEEPSFAVWADAPLWGPEVGFEQYLEGFDVRAPDEEGPVHLYVVVEDGRQGISWFVLDLEVVSR